MKSMKRKIIGALAAGLVIGTLLLAGTAPMDLRVSAPSPAWLQASSAMTILTLYVCCSLAGAALALWRPPRMPRYWLLLAIAAVPQLGSLLGIWIPGMFLVSVTAIFIWCLCNRAIAGIPAVATGVIINLLVMAFHGGAMPIHAETLAQIGHTFAPGTLLMGSKDVVVQSAALWLLSDWLVLPAGVATYVASPGDVVVIVGVIWWLLFSHTREERNDRCSRFVPHHPISARG